MLLKIKEEVKKQFDAGFLEVEKYLCHNGFPPRLGWSQKLNGVATDLFCIGVIGHLEYNFLN